MLKNAEKLRNLVEKQPNKDNVVVWLWAKSKGERKRFNLIVRLSDIHPFLIITALNIENNEWHDLALHDIEEIGPEINIPDK